MTQNIVTQLLKGIVLVVSSVVLLKDSDYFM